jgi:hypothetical protein
MNRAVTSYPAAGYRDPTSGAFSVTGSVGYAWSCDVTGSNVYYLRFDLDAVSPTRVSSRTNGFPVRCVQYLQFDLHGILNRVCPVQIFLFRLSDRNCVSYGFRECIKVNSVTRWQCNLSYSNFNLVLRIC